MPPVRPRPAPPPPPPMPPMEPAREFMSGVSRRFFTSGVVMSGISGRATLEGASVTRRWRIWGLRVCFCICLTRMACSSLRAGSEGDFLPSNIILGLG